MPHTMMASAGGSNTPLLDYESGVLPLHYTSGKACGLVGSKWHVDAATRTRDVGPGPVLEALTCMTTCKGSEPRCYLLSVTKYSDLW